MRIVVTGASGAIGRHLTSLLVRDGHEVVAVGRRADALPSGKGIEHGVADVADQDALAAVLEGADAAYYLVHSMAGGAGFAERDRRLARTFATASARAGVKRIVYLGALGEGRLSEHLASRREVGAILRAGGAEVVELRAAVILGAGSISFEMLRYLVERLPAMVCPRWVRTRISPVALADVMRYLTGSLNVAPGVYEIGIDEPTSYREMMDVYAAVRGLRRRMIVDVPVLTLTLSSYWVDLVTPVDRKISHALIESLANEVVVREADRTREAFGFEPMPLREAMVDALAAQAEAIGDELLDLRPGFRDGVHIVRVDHTLAPDDLERARRDLLAIGGDLRWYGLAWAWWLRLVLGRVWGERGATGRADELVPGAAVDWWTVVGAGAGELRLRATSWRAGEAWLGYRLGEDGDGLRQVAAFRPKGIPGLFYWRMLAPLHHGVFVAMARHRVARAAGGAR